MLGYLQPATLTAILWSVASGAQAHSPGIERVWWLSWTFTPFVGIATLLVLVMYARGAAHAGAWQRIGFIGGSTLLFLALQSPLDALAEESFAVHQLQHLVLHSLAPMLIALSAPAAALLAGMPAWMRRRAYVPAASNPAVRGAFSLLSTPGAAAAAFIATALFWLLPSMQAWALRNELIHDAMHFSMLVAGMFLYFCAFDQRPPPTGSRYGARVFALLAALFVNIPLGAYLSYKETLLYPAYGDAERLGLAPLIDERVGGLIQYVPGSMMFVLAVVFVLHAWRRQESRREGWRRRGVVRRPERGAPGGTLAWRNQRLGLALAGVCAFMFAAAIVGGILSHWANG